MVQNYANDNIKAAEQNGLELAGVLADTGVKTGALTLVGTAIGGVDGDVGLEQGNCSSGQ